MSLRVAKRTIPRQKGRVFHSGIDDLVITRAFICFCVAVGLSVAGLATGASAQTAPPAKAEPSKTAPTKPSPAKPATKPADNKPAAALKTAAPKATAPAAKAPEAKTLDAKGAETQSPEPKPSAADVLETATDSPEPSLPIPRFVSFRTDPVNLRTGPGVRYPVDWVYMRRRLPVEIIAEFETWRQIRDSDGAEGWVHQSMLSGRRTAMVRGEPQALRKANNDQSDPIAMLEPGVIVDVARCPVPGDFCRVEVNGLQGWLRRGQIWGVYTTETIE